MFKKLPLFAALILALSMAVSSCKVTMVPPKDPVMIVDVDMAADYMASMYDQMITSKVLDYKPYEEQYQNGAAQLDSIYARDQRRHKAGLITQQVKYLRDAYYEAWKYHKEKGKLTYGEAKIFARDNRRYWKPIRVSEMALK